MGGGGGGGELLPEESPEGVLPCLACPAEQGMVFRVLSLKQGDIKIESLSEQGVF